MSRPYVFCRAGYHDKCPELVSGKRCSCGCHRSKS